MKLHRIGARLSNSCQSFIPLYPLIHRVLPNMALFGCQKQGSFNGFNVIMASISFELIGSKKEKNIYLRLSVQKGEAYRKSTGYKILQDNWSKTTKLPKQNDASLKVLSNNLKQLEKFVLDRYNQAISAKDEVSLEWLKHTIDTFQGKRIETDPDRIITYIETFLHNRANDVNTKGIRKTSNSNDKQYRNLAGKIAEFEKVKKRKYYIKDVNIAFRNDFLQYLVDEKGYGENYVGRLMGYLKTVCNDAKTQGIETHHQLDAVKKFTAPKEPIVFLSFGELDKIQNTAFEKESLENARDWLLIGAYIGQRVSDLLKLTSENITVRSGNKVIELTQQKTGKLVVIPLHPTVSEILSKRDGEFPRKISDQRFNEYIKDVARIAGINKQVKGSKLNPESGRKEHGIYEKWELVASHICRRSFASNFYGNMPTPLIMNITAHSTEKQFMEYIGKTSTDHVQQIADYFAQMALEQSKQPVMNVLKRVQ